MSTLGFGGLLAGRLNLERPAVARAAAALMIAASLALTVTTGLLIITLAQVTLALLITVASIHVTRLLHDAVPSAVRTGVASGAGAISWIVFLPIALIFGIVSAQHDVHTAGWLLTALTVVAAALLTKLSISRRQNRDIEQDEHHSKMRRRNGHIGYPADRAD
jgi:hypothetical protein